VLPESLNNMKMGKNVLVVDGGVDGDSWLQLDKVDDGEPQSDNGVAC
jgi:hypothetical protein